MLFEGNSGSASRGSTGLGFLMVFSAGRDGIQFGRRKRHAYMPRELRQFGTPFCASYVRTKALVAV